MQKDVGKTLGPRALCRSLRGLAIPAEQGAPRASLDTMLALRTGPGRVSRQREPVADERGQLIDDAVGVLELELELEGPRCTSP